MGIGCGAGDLHGSVDVRFRCVMEHHFKHHEIFQREPGGIEHAAVPADIIAGTGFPDDIDTVIRRAGFASLLAA